MSEILGSIWWLLVALGLLITFHEFGHYWVARRLGVKVLRFSVGFGKPLWRRRGKDGVEYVVAALPLGGYVKMLDERETDVAADEAHLAFNRQSVWSRIAIVSAGPIFNLVFAVAAFWVMYLVGVPEARPIVGQVSGIAAEAGMRENDRILSLDGAETETWSQAILRLVTHALDRDRVSVEVEGGDGDRREVVLDLQQLGDDFREEETLQFVGITPWRAVIPAVVGEVSPGSPAEQAGFRPDDRIIRIGGEDVADWSWVPFLVQKHGEEGAGFEVVVERAGSERTLQVTPERQRSGLFSSRLVLGITNQGADDETRAALERAYFQMRFGPIEGFAEAVSETQRRQADYPGNGG